MDTCRETHAGSTDWLAPEAGRQAGRQGNYRQGRQGGGLATDRTSTNTATYVSAGRQAGRQGRDVWLALAP
jgi:hypothetical protein